MCKVQPCRPLLERGKSIEVRVCKPSCTGEKIVSICLFCNVSGEITVMNQGASWPLEIYHGIHARDLSKAACFVLNNRAFLELHSSLVAFAV